MELFGTPTRNVFFTGKGGVGKTSVACATAIALADAGKRVLLVSTDPASNLDEVLGVSLGSAPTAVPGAPGLSALNVDPEAAARAYRERVVGPMRGLLPDAALTSMEEQLSGGCTVEIAAFDEFSRLLGDPAATAAFDHVLFDTAPTGHTLRLLALPAAWTGFFGSNHFGGSCLGPLSGLQSQRALYEATLAALRDAARTTLALVTRPEPSALAEAERTSAELRALGVTSQRLIVNAVFHASDPSDPVAAAFERRGRAALEALPSGLRGLPRTEIPLSPLALLGPLALRAFGKPGVESVARGGVEPAVPGPSEPALPPPLAAIVDDIERAGRGLVLTMGKGGVGKTTIAAAIAVELAARGHAVQLSTTDPAAHVVNALAGEALAGLRVTRIDPAAETRAYSAEVLATAGAGLDADGRALLEEDLRSPCTEEIAVFRAFARTVAEAENGFVVLDTAPTGHTILLLDAAESYHREVARQASNMPESVRSLLPRLRDPAFTHVLIVTLPEATPVHEAARLQGDLARAGIRPYAWVVNQSLAAIEVHDDVLSARRAREARYMAEVRLLAARVALVPWLTEPPVGVERLRGVIGVATGLHAAASAP